MAKGSYKKNSVYVCSKCGNILQILEEGGGNIVCCLKALSEDPALTKKYQAPAPAATSSKADEDFEVIEEDLNVESDFEEVSESENGEDDLDLDLDIEGLNLDDDDTPSNKPSTSAKTQAMIKAVEKVIGGRKLTDEELEQIKRQDLFTVAEYAETPVEKKISQIGNVQITLACFGEMQSLEIHSHPNHHETIFVLEGRGTVYLGERANRSEIVTGAFFTVPKTIPHGFKNTQTSEMLLLWFHHE